MAATLIAVSNRDEITGDACLWVIVGANGAAWAVGIYITRPTQCSASVGNALAVVVTGAQGRVTALSDTVSIISAAGCACIAKEVAVLSGWALKILGALARAVWQTNRWVVVICAGVSRRTVSVVTRLWINAVRFFTNKPVGCAIELVIAGR